MIYQPYQQNYPQFQPNIGQPNIVQPNIQNNFQQQTNPIPQQQIQPTIQNGGFVSVRNEQEARNYPVAPGISLTFKDENSPYVYTKTMGFSQLDRPQFEKYRLVKEEAEIEQPQQEQTETPSYLVEEDLNPIFDKLKEFKRNYEELKNDFKQMKIDFKDLEKNSVKQVTTKSTTTKPKEEK